MKFSVIIPTWNEGRQIASALRRLREISDEEHMEVIVVDGVSQDKTDDTAKRWADRIERTDEPNRGKQLHAGAKAASGDMLFFLHADTQPPGDWQEKLERFWLASHDRPPAATVFTVDYGTHWDYRLVAFGQNLRVGWRQVAYGDAGFCTTREIYEASGGFPEIPLLEDVVFSSRLTRQGPIVRLPQRIHPAARRLHKFGPIPMVLRNFWIRFCFSLGASPEGLWKRYYAKRPDEAVGLADGEKALRAAVEKSRRVKKKRFGLF